jgi:hypothetical protein
MHTALNYLDAEQAQYRALNATLATAPLPHLETADRRAQRNRLARIPHIDADVVRRAILTDRADRIVGRASMAAGVMAGVVALGAAAQVVALYVGGVL